MNQRFLSSHLFPVTYHLDKYKLPLLISLLLIAGIFYRIKIASYFPHEPIADEKAYLEMAGEMTRQFLVGECCTRGFTYPMFLSGIFRIAGMNNLVVVALVQAILDTFTAIILFLAAGIILKDKKQAFWVLLIYLFNPLTSSYTGVILTEVPALFLFSVSLLFLVRSDRFISRLISGISMGLFIFCRLMFFYLGIALIPVIFISDYISNRKLTPGMFGLVVGLLLTFIYPTMANIKYFNYYSPLPSTPGIYYDFLVSLKIERWPMLLPQWYKEVEPVMLSDFRIDFYNRETFLRETSGRFWVAWDEIKKNPAPFLGNRIRHFFYVWNKGNLYIWTDPFYPEDREIISLVNGFFLLSSLLGIYSMARSGKNLKEDKGFIFAALMLAYFLAVLPMRIPEERLTLPAYPILTVFTPLGIVYFVSGLRKKFISGKPA